MDHIIKVTAVPLLIGVAGFLLYQSHAESPRLECLKSCQNAHNACLASAGSDQSKRSECNKEASECEKMCPPPG